MLRTRSLLALATLMIFLMLGVHPLHAQQPQVSPRTPMGPGSPSFGETMLPMGAREGAAWLGLRPNTMYPQMLPPQFRAAPPSSDQSALEAAAIQLVKSGSAELVVSSRADKELILQLYRPDLTQWQEVRLPPFANTQISCASCAGKLKLTFNNGAQDVDIDVAAPALLRIFPDAAGQVWQWDVFKLQAAAQSR
jgi:hypothetical protein